jgi:hypothetical protein
VAALLDVQLDEDPDAGERRLVETDVLGGVPGRGHRVGEGRAVVVGQRERVPGVDRAGHQPRAEAGEAEPGALLLDEVDDGERALGHDARSLQRVDGEQGADDAERPVERAAAGHAVEVAAGDDGAVGRRAPPGPLVAVAVDLDLEPPPGRLGGEPLPEPQVDTRPREPVVATGARIATHALEIAPDPVEGGAQQRAVGRRPATGGRHRRCPRCRLRRSSRSRRSRRESRRRLDPRLLGPARASGCARRARPRRRRPARTRRRRGG